MHRTFMYALQATLVLACQSEDFTGLLGSAAGPLVGGGSHVDDPAAPAPPPSDVVQVTQALRRAYGASDLRFYECASLSPSGDILGKACIGGFVAFGPYVSAPAKCDIEVSFTVESDEDMIIVSDVVSDLGRQFHGGLGQQMISAKEARALSYRIHLDEAKEAVEARILIRPEAPTNFKISGFAMTIR